MSSHNSSKHKHLYWLDYLKGLAILGIVFFHFFQNYHDPSDLVSLLYRTGTKLGYACVDIFFVIAGFNTSYSLAKFFKNSSTIKINWIEWLKKRFLRVYPTYWLAIILTLLLIAIFAKIEIKSLSDFGLIWLGFPGYNRFKTLNPGLWFFAVIVQCYLSIPLIFYICKNNRENLLWLGIFIGVINKFACLINLANPTIFWFLLQNNFLGSYFFPLCLGLYWGFTYFDHQEFRTKDWLISSIVFIFGLTIYGIVSWSGIDVIYMLGFDLMFTPLFILLSYWLCEYAVKRVTLLSNILAILGNKSYEIYLIHQPLFFIVLYNLTNIIKLSTYPKLGLILVLATICLTIYVIIFSKLDAFLRLSAINLSKNLI